MIDLRINHLPAHIARHTEDIGIGCADLYAGLGGFSEGAKQAGVRVRMASNHNTDAIYWHEANHLGTVHLKQDIQQMDFSLLPDLSEGILIASPCCQGYSTGGQPAAKGTGGNSRPDVALIKRKHDADRATSWAVLAAMDAARPAALIVENVKQFLAWDLFGGWRSIIETSLGYHFRIHVLDARGFGSAQARTRVVITAGRDRPFDIDSGDVIANAGRIGDCLDPDDHPGNRWTDLTRKSARMLPRMRKAQNEAGARCFWNNVSESSGRPLDAPFPTVTTKSAGQMYLLDGDRGRILNSRELARAQSFPDTYALPKNRELAGVLIGNAIDVSMARGVIGQLAATL